MQENQLSARQAEVKELSNARSEVERLEQEVSQTRILLRDAQEQLHRKLSSSEQHGHESPSAYSVGGSDDAGAGRRRPLAAAAGPSHPEVVVTSPAGSDRQHQAVAQKKPGGSTSTAAEMLFAALDADGDGYISRREMTEGLASAGTAQSSSTRGAGGSTAARSPVAGGLGADERSVLRGAAVGDSATQWCARKPVY